MGLIDDKADLIFSADQKFLNSLDKIDQQLAKEIIKIYAKFVTGKNLELNALEMAKIDDAIILAIAKKTDYKLATNAYIKNFDAIDAINAKIHKQVNKIDINAIIEENVKIKNFRSVVESNLRATPTTVISYIDKEGKIVESAFRNDQALNQLVQPISEMIKKDIILGVSFEDATELMLEAIEKKKLGLGSYAGQISRDALSQADGIVNDEVRKEFDMEWVTYQGTLKTTSRPFCRHMVLDGPVWKYDDLQKEIDKYAPGGIPIKGKGDGMIAGTTAENIMIRRGGYNCYHIITPSLLGPDE